MGTGQTILTIGALALLSFTVFNANHNFTQIDVSLVQNKSRLEALSLLSSHIEQASQFVFDEAIADTLIANKLSNFTPQGQFGFDANDYGIIDDFDDFHGLTIADTGKSDVIFNVYYEVDYVKLQNNIIVKSNSKEYHKRMTIRIFDAYDPPLIYKYQNGNRVKDTLSVSFVHSYWFYN